jgi:hypothetical protein
LTLSREATRACSLPRLAARVPDGRLQAKGAAPPRRARPPALSAGRARRRPVIQRTEGRRRSEGQEAPGSPAQERPSSPIPQTSDGRCAPGRRQALHVLGDHGGIGERRRAVPLPRYSIRQSRGSDAARERRAVCGRGRSRARGPRRPPGARRRPAIANRGDVDGKQPAYEEVLGVVVRAPYAVMFDRRRLFAFLATRTRPRSRGPRRR